MVRSVLFVLSIAALASCATTGTQVASDGRLALDKAALCCKTLHDANALPLPADKQSLRIDETKQAYTFNGSKSFFMLYRLPEFSGTYSVTLTSSPGGTTEDAAILLPRVTTYDAAFNAIRHFDERTLRSRGSAMERTVFINASNAGERYIAIHAADLSAPIERTVSVQTVQQFYVGTGFVMFHNGQDVKAALRPAPVGSIEIEVSKLTP